MSTPPGNKAVTRTPCGDSSAAALRVKASSAPLALAMAAWLGKPCAQATVEKSTTEPLLAASAGAAALTASAALRKFRLQASEKSLADWLEDAHNYPEMMDFTLTRPQIDQIAAYMVTLRKAGYVSDE